MFLEARPKLLSYCRKHTANPHRAEEVFQNVSERALRGFSTFRGDSTFLTWIYKIAGREVRRHERGCPSPQLRRPFSLCSLDALLETNPGHPVIHDVCADVQDSSILPFDVKRAVIPEAATENALSSLEAQVLLLWLDHPTTSLPELAPRLGITHQNFATIKCRAHPKLRVYLLMNFERFFGSLDLLQQAFDLARSCSGDPLTAKESITFQNIVLLQNSRWKIKDSKTILRSACTKVARHLGWMF